MRSLGAGLHLQLKSILFAAVFTALLVSASRAAEASRRRAWCLYGVASTWFLLRLAQLWTDHSGLMAATYVAALGFLGYVIVLLLRVLLEVRFVDTETIAASLCVYLLMGIFWAVAYALVEKVQPGSFNIPDGTPLDFAGEGAANANYFSFVTLTTLGYGDITPKSDVTRTMAITEAVIGQVFLVVLVARLVGMKVAQAIQRKQGQNQ